MIFTYRNGVDKNDKIISHNYDDIDMDKIPSYKYTFTKSGNGYYLISIDRG